MSQKNALLLTELTSIEKVEYRWNAYKCIHYTTPYTQFFVSYSSTSFEKCLLLSEN